MKRRAKRIMIGMCVASLLCQSGISNAYAMDFSVSELVDQAKDQVTDYVADSVKEYAKDYVKEQTIGKISDAFSDATKKLVNSIEDIDCSGEMTQNIKDDLCEKVLEVIDDDSDITEMELEDFFYFITEKLGMESSEVEDLWESVMDFAEQNDIDAFTISKMAIAATVCAVKEDGFSKDVASSYIKASIGKWILDAAITNAQDHLFDIIKFILEEVREGE